MRREALRRYVIFVEPPSGLAHLEGADGLTRWEALEVGDADLDDKATGGLEVGGHVAEHATCVVRFMIVLKTRYARENDLSTVVVAKSPMVTLMFSAPGLARSLATIAFDNSMP